MKVISQNVVGRRLVLFEGNSREVTKDLSVVETKIVSSTQTGRAKGRPNVLVGTPTGVVVRSPGSSESYHRGTGPKSLNREGRVVRPPSVPLL